MRYQETQELNTAQRALVTEAYERLALWRDACSGYHKKAKESRRILALDDPLQDAPGAAIKTLQLHTLKSTFNGCVADQIDNMPEAVMIPERPDVAQTAEELTDVTRWVFGHNNYEALHRKRVEDCFCTGTSVTQVAWDPDMDYGEGNIAILRWPVEAFLWDPAAENLQDARAVFKVSWHPMSWYEQHYPEQYSSIGSDEGEYSTIGVSDVSNIQADEERAMLMEYWYRMFDAKKRRYTINVAYLAGGALLELSEDIYQHGRYPFKMDVFSRIEGTPVGEGMIQELAPMMRYINRYAAYIDMNLRMSAKGRLLVNRNAGIDVAVLADWEKDIIEADRIDTAALQWLQSQPFTGMVSNQMMQLQTDLKQDSGQNQFTRGETTGGVTAFGAINALQEAGGKITRLRTFSLNDGFREICEQVMWLISQFYDEKRVLYITGMKTEQPREVVLDTKKIYGKKPSGKSLPPPPYTVQVQVQRRNPMRVQAQNDLFMQMYTMAAQAQQYFPISVLLELLQVDGKEKILPVIRQNESQAQQMQEMAAQNEQLAQENAQLQEGVGNLQALNQKITQTMRKEPA